MDRHVEVLQQRVQPLRRPPAPPSRNVSNGLLWTTIRKRKNISTTAIVGDDPRDEHAMPLAVDVARRRCRTAASSVTQNMIEPSSPPQYDASL